jgi:hypothetical protein
LGLGVESWSEVSGLVDLEIAGADGLVEVEKVAVDGDDINCVVELALTVQNVSEPVWLLSSSVAWE